MLDKIRKVLIFLAILQVPIASYASETKISIQSGHLSMVSAAAFSPDGQFIITGGLDHVVRVWNLNGRLIRVIEGFQGFIEDLIVFGKENRIITASSDGKIMLFSFNGDLKKILYSGEEYEIKAIHMAPDNRTIYITRFDSVARFDLDGNRLWDIKTEQKNTNITLSSDGSFFVSAGETPQIKTWSSEGKEKGGFITSQFISHDHSPSNNKDWRTRHVRMDRKGNVLIENGDLSVWSLSGHRLSNVVDNLPKRLSLKSFLPLSNGAACTFDSSQVFRVYSLQKKILCEVDFGESIDVLSVSNDERFFVLGGSRGSIALVSTNGEVLFHNKSVIEGISSLSVTRDDLRIIAGTRDGNVQVWSMTGRLEKTFQVSSTESYGIKVALDPSGQTIYSADSREHISSWSLTGELKNIYFKQGIFSQKSNSGGIAVSPNGRTIATELNSGVSLLTPDLQVSSEVDFNKAFISKIIDLNFSADGGDILASAPEGLWLIPIIGGKINSFKKEVNGYLNSAVSAPDGNTLVSVYGSNVDSSDGKAEGTIVLWSLEGKEKKVLKSHGGNATCVAYDPNGKFFVTGGNDKIIRLWAPQGRPVRVFEGHADRIQCLTVSHNGRKIISGGNDGIVKVWDVETGSNVSLVSVAGNWIAFSSDGYFDSSRDAGQILGMTLENRSFGIDQFAIRNNRPDIILGLLGAGNQEVKDHYRAQFQKRLRRLGVNENDLAYDAHLPNVDIVRSSIEGSNARISLRFSDTRHRLLSYNIFINGVPLYGVGGKPLKSKNFELEETIALSAGRNKVEVSCVNEKGVESYRALVLLSREGAEKGSLYFLGFGVSRYMNPALNLNYAAKDAEDLSNTFKKMVGQYKSVFVKTLTDEQVTVSGIRSSKEFIKSAGPDDTLVLFIAGHGIHDNDTEGSYYFLTHNADLTNLSQTAARFDLIEDLLHEIQPRNKLFLMDTCESGELDPEIEKSYFAMARTTGIYARAIQERGINISLKEARPRPYLFEQDRYIYNDLLRRSGAIVFSSSRGGEFSYESDNLKNGFFTSKFIEGLWGSADLDRNGMITIDELKNYVSNEVPKLSNNKQHPTVDRDNVLAKFSFPRLKR